MQVVNYVMKHPIITAWGLAILAILLNWNSGGHSTGSSALDVSDSVNSSTQLNTQHKMGMKGFEHSNEKSVVHTANLENDQRVGVAIVPAIIPSLGQNAVKAAVGINQNKTPSDTGSQSASTAINHAETLVAKKHGKQNTEKLVDKPLDNTIYKQKINPARDLSLLSASDLLFQARKAFWQKNYMEATVYYEALIDREPRTIAHRGELGNVFWHSGRERDAAILYGQIAEPMIYQGKINDVLRFMGFVGVYFPERAEQLTKMIQNQ